MIQHGTWEAWVHVCRLNQTPFASGNYFLYHKINAWENVESCYYRNTLNDFGNLTALNVQNGNTSIMLPVFCVCFLNCYCALYTHIYPEVHSCAKWTKSIQLCCMNLYQKCSAIHTDKQVQLLCIYTYTATLNVTWHGQKDFEVPRDSVIGGVEATYTSTPYNW